MVFKDNALLSTLGPVADHTRQQVQSVNVLMVRAAGISLLIDVLVYEAPFSSKNRIFITKGLTNRKDIVRWEEIRK